jgi:hypothetical protein
MFLIRGPSQGIAGNLVAAADFSQQWRLVPHELGLHARPMGASGS